MRSDKSDSAVRIERRRYRRHSAVDFVWYKVVPETGGELADSAEGLSNMCDISKTGIGLYVTQSFALGTMVFLELSGKKLSLSAVGEVVSEIRIRENYYRTGIHFKIMPPNDRMTLNSFTGEK